MTMNFEKSKLTALILENSFHPWEENALQKQLLFMNRLKEENKIKYRNLHENQNFQLFYYWFVDYLDSAIEDIVIDIFPSENQVRFRLDSVDTKHCYFALVFNFQETLKLLKTLQNTKIPTLVPLKMFSNLS